MTITRTLDRIPPHNLDAERAVLGRVLEEGPAALTAVTAKLEVSDFYTEGHRAIFETMVDMAAAEHDISIITLAEALRRRDQLDFVGGPAALALLLEHAAIGSRVGSYLFIIRQLAMLRELIQTSSQVLTRAYEARDDVQLLLDESQEMFERIAKRALLAESPLTVYSAAELVAAAIAEPTFHVEGWIPAAGITFLVGDSEAFKSWFAMYLGFCIASGRAVFDRLTVRQAPVLIISEENGIVEDRRRIDLIARGMGFELEKLPLYIVSEAMFSFDDPIRYAALRAFIDSHGIRLVLIDSFVRVHRREEKDAGAMNALYMDRMKPLVRSGVDLLLLHHKRKLPAGIHPSQQQASSDNDDIRGSGDLRAAAHAVLFLKKLTDLTVVVRHNKARGFKKQEPFVFSIKDDGIKGGVVLTHEGKPADVLDKSGAAREAVLGYAAEHLPGFFRADVITALKGKFSKKIIDAMLTEMSSTGYPLKADEVQSGRTKKKFFLYVSAAPDPADPGDEADVPF